MCPGSGGPTLNIKKSQDLVTKNPKIEQKFPSYTENYEKTVKMITIYIRKYSTNGLAYATVLRPSVVCRRRLSVTYVLWLNDAF